MFLRRFLANPTIQRRWYTPLGSHVSDDDPAVLDREKQRLLRGQVKPNLKSAPGWNEQLASDSEAMIKAEREPDSVSLKDLQQESIHFLSNVEVVEQFKEKVKVQATEEKVITAKLGGNLK